MKSTLLLALVLALYATLGLAVVSAVAQSPGTGAELLERENKVEASRQLGPWVSAEAGLSLAVKDRVRTGELSRATVRLTDLSLLRLDELTKIEILPPARTSTKPKVDLSNGAMYFFSREKPRELEIRTPAATGALRGTEFHVRVSAGGRTRITMFEGEVELANAQGRIVLQSGEAGEVEPGRAPRKTAVIEAVNIIQWCLYYPAVLDAAALQFPQKEAGAFRKALDAYRQGDLLGALRIAPKGRGTSRAGRAFRAALVLSVGQVGRAEEELRQMDRSDPDAQALRQMIAAVKFQEFERQTPPTTASEWMAESYYQQSRSALEPALEAARKAVELSPEFGFGWTRVAELEFSFGRTSVALAALERGLKLTPRNAQAHALRGFLLSAQNRIGAAREAFEEAIGLDGALGNAWLGRGLCLIRKGNEEAGRRDLQTAAALEPHRSILRSYLGKAFSQTGDAPKATNELDRAREIDPADPTPWLYSAIEKKQANRYNEAVEDLSRSIELNENRRVYRSRFLLDQDLSVRSANLARIYQNNGMNAVAFREATRAVESDYTNASSHLFLANAFDLLRDPTRILLRFETAWFNELLLAHLLSPVGGGPLSQFVSQQEYSKLFQRDGIGGNVTSEYRDNGRIRAETSLYGTFGDLSFGIDSVYFYDNGYRPNNAVSREEIYWQFKYQVTPDDIFYTFGQWQDNEFGDLSQSYFDLGDPGFQFEEKQEPGQIIVGWNHRWAPGVHTLLLGARLAAEQFLTDPNTRQPLLFRQSSPQLQDFFNRAVRNPQQPPVTKNPDRSLNYPSDFLKGIEPFTGRLPVTSIFNEQFRFSTLRQFEIYSGEIQHIWETDRNTLIVGGRWQGGEFETDTRLDLLNPVNNFLFSNPAALQSVSVDFERATIYLYDFFKLTPWLTLIGGASWDKIEKPVNFRNPPVSLRSEENEEYNAKAGFTFSPSRAFTMRGVFTQGMGGVTFEDSVRLEPVQLAGFNQAFRTLISESLVGSVEAPEYTNWGLSIEGELPTRTWWGASINVLEQDVRRTVGAFDGFNAFPLFPAGAGYVPGGATQMLSYREEVFSATLNQLIGREFSVGAGYRYTRASLRDRFPQVETFLRNATPLARQASRADRVETGKLHEVTLFANWNSPTGLFARAEGRWYSQDLDSRSSGFALDGLAGDDFWHFDAQIGYRFARNQCEVSAGVLNIGDTNYQLSPLTFTNEIPRERTYVLRCRLSF